MQRINRETLKMQAPRKQREVGYFLSGNKNGRMGLSKGLYRLLGEPSFVELFEHDGKVFICQSDAKVGFWVNVNSRLQCACFTCKPAFTKYFSGIVGRAVVYTDPVSIEGAWSADVKFYEIRLPVGKP